MSIFFKNITFLKLREFTMAADQLADILAAHPLQHCEGDKQQTFGWVIPHKSSESMVARSQGQMLIALGMEKKILPPSVINEYTKAKIAEIEELEGAKVGRKRAQEIKEQVAHELLARAFVVRGKTSVWLDPKNGLIVVDGGDNAADEVIEALHKAMPNAGSLDVQRFKTETSASQAMTHWLSTQESPTAFTVDQDCELQSADGAAVRYAHHNLDVMEIPNHIAEGKRATKLAMTWDDKITFVLTETMSIKKIGIIGTVKESCLSVEDFESEFSLMTGEYAKLIKAVVSMLGESAAEK